MLEIGAFEGRSTTYFIDNYLFHKNSTIETVDPFDTKDPTTPLTNYTYNIFLKNIKNSRYPEKSYLHKEYSKDILPVLLTQKKQYDLITIDGSHLIQDVLFDAVNCFYLTKVGGYMFFDDYGAGDPKKAIDAFVRCFSEKIKVIHTGYHLALIKLSE